MTVEELKTRCRDRGIKGYSGLKKAQIIKLLRKGSKASKGSRKSKGSKSRKGSRKSKGSKSRKGSKGRPKKSVAGGACVTSKNCRKGYTCDREQLVCREYLPRGGPRKYGPHLPPGWAPEFGPRIPDDWAKVRAEQLLEKAKAQQRKVPCESYQGPLMCKLEEGCSWVQPGGPCRPRK